MDAVPATLMPVLARMMRETLPVLVSTAHRLSEWVVDNGIQAGKEVPRHIGNHDFTLDGVTESRAVAPYSLWMLQRVLDHLAGLEGAAKDNVSALLIEAGGDALLSFPSFPRLARRNYRLILA
jgi:hypothetical protein